ncbi:MAG: hypothetical protein QM527_02925 [Alphaproteobacteria bacterium]|nr:hypothetical protein [Alphaproteobacteria bacterium]
MWLRLPFKLEEFLGVLFAALVYTITYIFSFNLSESFEFSHATSWVFLPSGVRLLLVLTLLGQGAMGVWLGTLLIDYVYMESSDHLYNWVTAAVAGGSAYISLKLAQNRLGLGANLHQLTQAQLMGICMIFSVLSPLLHQIWFWLHGDTYSFIQSWAVMALGDLGGSMIIRGGMFILLRLIRWIAGS